MPHQASRPNRPFALLAGAFALPLMAVPGHALLLDNVADETILACQADAALQGCATVLTGIYVCENAPDMQGCAEFAQRLGGLEVNAVPDNPAEAAAASEGDPALEEVVVNARGEGALVDDLDAEEFTPEELANQEPEDAAARDAREAEADTPVVSRDAPADAPDATTQQAPGLADAPETTVEPQPPETDAEPDSDVEIQIDEIEAPADGAAGQPIPLNPAR